MECPFCKEEIKEGARKCKVCGEFLGHRGRLKIFTGLISVILSILIPIGTTTIAILEFQARNRAVEEKKLAERKTVSVEKEANVLTRVLKNNPNADKIVRKAALTVDPEIVKMYQGYREIEKGNYLKAESEFKNIIKQSPEDEKAQRGLIYSRVLKKLESR